MLNASYSVPSISISSRPSSGAASTSRRSAIAKQGLPYSLIRPSVDQVSEYLRTLFGCWGRAPTRMRMLRSSSKCEMSSFAAIEMKPGRQPALRHEGRRRALGRRAHGARDLDVLGQVEVVQARVARDLRDARVAVEGQRRNHRITGVLGHVPGEGRRIRRVHAVGGDVALAVRAGDRARRVDVDVGQLDFVAAGVRQQARDQRTDLAGAQDEYAMHRNFT